MINILELGRSINTQVWDNQQNYQRLEDRIALPSDLGINMRGALTARAFNAAAECQKAPLLLLDEPNALSDEQRDRFDRDHALLLRSHLVFPGESLPYIEGEGVLPTLLDWN